MGNSLTSNEFLFSFESRINRAKYWYAVFASSAACLAFLSVVAFAIGGIFGSKVKSVHADLFDFLSKLPSFPFTISFRDAAPTPAATVLFYVTGSPIFVVSVWFLAAATIKRLHDRNKNGWWIIPFFIVPGLLDKLSNWIDDPTAALFVNAIGSGLGVWCFVELLCLKGTRGPNRFGPDPLAPADIRPRWDQQSELEFVPHSTGPSAGAHVKRGA
jgi:uncharacterized membrane protein YhaH (DUF805 family)